MAEYTFILNPSSNRGTVREAAPALESLLAQHTLDYQLNLTEKPWHAANLARRAAREGSRVVVAVGGDGTANEVLNGLMQAKQEDQARAVLGVVGIGRGNDFAYGVGIPTGINAGIEALMAGGRRAIDVGLVRGGQFPEGRFFGNGVGIGFDAVVGFEALKMTRLSGFFSYLVAALKTVLLYYRAPLVEIRLNGERLELSSLMISVMNGRRMGGGFMMAPEAVPDDGMFDLCLAEQVSKAGILALIPRFMQGTQESHPAIQFSRTSRLYVRALEGTLPAHADGETLCVAGDQLHVEIYPKGIEIISPGLT